MKYNYFKQAFSSIRQQPVVSVVSIIGTGACYPAHHDGDHYG